MHMFASIIFQSYLPNVRECMRKPHKPFLLEQLEVRSVETLNWIVVWISQNWRIKLHLAMLWCSTLDNIISKHVLPKRFESEGSSGVHHHAWIIMKWLLHIVTRVIFAIYHWSYLITWLSLATIIFKYTNWDDHPRGLSPHHLPGNSSKYRGNLKQSQVSLIWFTNKVKTKSYSKKHKNINNNYCIYYIQ